MAVDVYRMLTIIVIVDNDLDQIPVTQNVRISMSAIDLRPGGVTATCQSGDN